MPGQKQDISRLNFACYELRGVVDFKIQNARCLSFPDRGFDVIFCISVYYHLEIPFQVLEEILRILSLKEKIVSGDFNKKGMDIINE